MRFFLVNDGFITFLEIDKMCLEYFAKIPIQSNKIIISFIDKDRVYNFTETSNSPQFYETNNILRKKCKNIEF